MLFPGNNKNKQLLKNIHCTNANQLKKRIATQNTTIESKSNEKNYLQYKTATELSKLTKI